MDPAFWHERWREGRIGFHEGEGNAQLRALWPPPGVAADAAVFVPLCGKSRDLAWLAGRGHRVVGVELSEIAVADFFREQGVAPVRASAEAGTWWRGGGIEILCGDFFAMRPADLGAVGAWFDRAALIALPPELRRRYRDHLAALLPAGAGGLLITLDYPEGEREPPPFPVAEEEVLAWRDAGFAVEPRARVDRLEVEPQWREQGVTRLEERAYLLRRG